jgi:hypothetical protein
MWKKCPNRHSLSSRWSNIDLAANRFFPKSWAVVEEYDKLFEEMDTFRKNGNKNIEKVSF